MTIEDGNPAEYLKKQPGQVGGFSRKFHPLPGPYAQEQMNRGGKQPSQEARAHRPTSDLQKALAEEKARIEESMKQQGIIPARAVYADPVASQNTLLPTEKYANG